MIITNTVCPPCHSNDRPHTSHISSSSPQPMSAAANDAAETFFFDKDHRRESVVWMLPSREERRECQSFFNLCFSFVLTLDLRTPTSWNFLDHQMYLLPTYPYSSQYNLTSSPSSYICMYLTPYTHNVLGMVRLS
ncbi:hypothetical protein L249_1559 [Ophiocordyceps polyrhachis-furcata BCC 54312]|uniref:Uncharacterized protein n=1 Tax=Ophiocordyceps polyrhachis-furcata BCC 54312 TaxID=1330021 RepID=A0A367L4W0_9HYPO|nr:hypothetical protein L249_1559 [Ophiocordyceps polyrhachis-furcata BCC 54312]